MTQTLERPPTEQLTDKQKFEKLLEARFGPGMMADHYMVTPKRLVNNYSVMMTATELALWTVITSFQYDAKLPYPSIDTIARIMKKSYRTIERYIKRMEDKGLLRVERDPGSLRGLATNRYDFRPLYDKIVALYDQEHAANLLDNNFGKTSSNGLGSQVNPLTTMSDGRYLTTDSPTEVSAKVSLEESNQEDLPRMERFESSKRFALNLEGEEGRTDVHADNKNPPVSSPSSNNSYEGLSKTNQYDGADQQTSNHSKPGPGGAVPAEAGEQAQKLTLPLHAETVVETISRLYGDLVHVRSNYTQAANIWEPARLLGMTEEGFVESLYWARGITSAKPNVESRMKYFFTVLRNGIDGLCTQWREDDRLAAEQGRQGTS